MVVHGVIEQALDTTARFRLACLELEAGSLQIPRAETLEPGKIGHAAIVGRSINHLATRFFFVSEQVDQGHQAAANSGIEGEHRDQRAGVETFLENCLELLPPLDYPPSRATQIRHNPTP